MLGIYYLNAVSRSSVTGSIMERSSDLFFIQDGTTTHLMSDVETITPLLEERKNTLGMY